MFLINCLCAAVLNVVQCVRILCTSGNIRIKFTLELTRDNIKNSRMRVSRKKVLVVVDNYRVKLVPLRGKECLVVLEVPGKMKVRVVVNTVLAARISLKCVCCVLSLQVIDPPLYFFFT